MKKLFLIVLMVALISGLVACKPSETKPTGNSATINGATDITLNIGDPFNPMTGVTATDTKDGNITSSIQVTGTYNLNAAGNYTLTYTVVGSDGKTTTVIRKVTVLTESGCSVWQEKINGVCVDIPKQDVVIMHGAVHEVDPFHTAFSGTEQLLRQQAQRAVEAKYNVNVIYRAYPAEAAWGPSRVDAIIRSSVSGNHLSDIYWITSDWIGQLASNQAIVSVDQYLDTIGSNIDLRIRNVGSYRDSVYAFAPDKLTVSNGLYYNADLVASLGVQNPTQMYLAGNWNWTTFEAWAKTVQTALNAQGDDMYALGGVLAFYAENMVPLNGGSLINATTKRVAFAQNPALETYTFLTSLYTQGLFELTPQYDAGSPEWQAGKVAMHPGNLWFVNADNRWGNLTFELGFVPYPKSPTFQGDYVSPVSGVAMYSIASGMTPQRQELVFKVWNELQLWKTEAQYELDFELSLITKFDKQIYIDAYMSIYDKVYLELIYAIGIQTYGPDGFRPNINIGIREGTSRTVVDTIKPIYDAALEAYLNQ
jgi:fructooligosaccharide transport system substrate-binding protein